jgi:hypothetical protein
MLIQLIKILHYIHIDRQQVFLVGNIQNSFRLAYFVYICKYNNLLEPHKHVGEGTNRGLPRTYALALLPSQYCLETLPSVPHGDMAPSCTLICAGQTQSRPLQHIHVCSLTTGLIRDLLDTGIGIGLAYVLYHRYVF